MKLLEPNAYQPTAEKLFAEVAREVQATLPLAAVEHVGASSIFGALSKGDLDICVIVACERHQQAVSSLEVLGYTVKQKTLRTDELCMLESPRYTGVALQVIARGSRFESFIHFRDALRAAPTLVAEYNEVKRRYVSVNASIYREEKSRFIERVLRGT